MRKRGSKTSLFLMEMLLVILFFSIAAAICLRVFAAARQRSVDSADLSGAVIAAQSEAERFRAAVFVDDLEALAVSGGAVTEGPVHIYYDAKWKPCEEARAAYCLTMHWVETTAQIEVTRIDGTEIYDLSVRSSGGVN